jgi:hypothetical protein
MRTPELAQKAARILNGCKLQGKNIVFTLRKDDSFNKLYIFIY